MNNKFIGSAIGLIVGYVGGYAVGGVPGVIFCVITTVSLLFFERNMKEVK